MILGDFKIHRQKRSKILALNTQYLRPNLLFPSVVISCKAALDFASPPVAQTKNPRVIHLPQLCLSHPIPSHPSAKAFRIYLDHLARPPGYHPISPLDPGNSLKPLWDSTLHPHLISSQHSSQNDPRKSKSGQAFCCKPSHCYAHRAPPTQHCPPPTSSNTPLPLLPVLWPCWGLKQHLAPNRCSTSNY